MKVADRLERGDVIRQPRLPLGLEERQDPSRSRRMLYGLEIIAELGEHREARQVPHFGDARQVRHLWARSPAYHFTEGPVDLLEGILAGPVEERMDDTGTPLAVVPA